MDKPRRWINRTLGAAGLALLAGCASAPASDLPWQAADPVGLAEIRARLDQAVPLWRAGAPDGEGIDLRVEADLLRVASAQQSAALHEQHARQLMQQALRQTWQRWRTVLQDHDQQQQALQRCRERLAPLHDSDTARDELRRQEVALQQITLRREALAHTLAALSGQPQLARPAQADAVLRRVTALP